VENVSFTLSLCALPTAIIPSRDHTGFPSTPFLNDLQVASRMVLRTLASIFAGQSVSPAISWSMRPMDSLDL